MLLFSITNCGAKFTETKSLTFLLYDDQGYGDVGALNPEANLGLQNIG